MKYINCIKWSFIKTLVHVLSIVVLLFSHLHAQNQNDLKVDDLEKKANLLFETFRYDSAAYFYFQAAKIFEKQENWLACAKTYRLTANSLFKFVRIDTSLYFSQKALDIANHHFTNKNKEEAFEKVEIYLILGESYMLSDRYHLKGNLFEKGLELYNTALKTVLQTDSTAKLKIAKIWNHIGYAYLALAKYKKAIEFCSKSYELRQKLLGNNHIDVAESLYNLGIINFHVKDYEEALECANNALKIRLQYYGGYHPEIALCYRLIGIIYNYKKETERALKYHLKALEIRSAIFGNYYDVAQSSRAIARIYHNKGEFDKALKYYNKAAKIWAQTPPDYFQDLQYTYDLIGMIYAEKGDFDEAIGYYTKALNIRTQVYGQNSSSVGISYFYLGTAHKDMGKYGLALENYQKALQIWSRALGWGNHYIGAVYSEIGEVFYQKGDYETALEYFQNALAIKIKNSGKQDLSNYTTLHSIGDVYKKKNDYGNALLYYQKSTDILIKTFGGQHHSVARHYNDFGMVYSLKGEYDRALGYYQKALDILIKIYGEGNLNVANSYNNFGETYSQMEEYEKALEYHHKALNIRLQTYGNVHPDICTSYNNLGNVYSQNADYNKALVYYQKALMANLVGFNDSVVYSTPVQLNALSKPLLLKTLNAKASTFYQLYKNSSHHIGDLKAVLSNYELAFKLVNNMRNDYSYESSQLLLSKGSKNMFVRAVLVSMELDKITDTNEKSGKTFEYIEKSKSATLSAYLMDANIKQYWDIADTLLKKEKDIAINRRNLGTRIQKEKSAENGYDTVLVQQLEKELFFNSRQNDSLVNKLKRDYPDYYQLKYEQKVAGVEAVRNGLDENSALINYFVGDTTLFICLVTNDKIAYKEVRISEQFQEKIMDYYIDIKSGFTENDLKNSNRLYQYLIKPISTEITNKSNLIIIPDEVLYYVPFETLCEKDTYSADLSKPDYLIKSYSFSYHHSATLWLNSKEKTKKQHAIADNFIGFAPVFDPKVNKGYILSSDWITDTTNTEIATRSISTDLKHFNTLEYSEKEINSIVKLFDQHKKEARGYFHKDASERNFKQNASKYKYVHIATHSFVNDRFTSLSGIAFSQPDTSIANKNQAEDGILYAGETYNLDLQNADLVVLSSCKSGLGRLIRGEGFLSLSRGFLYSETPNIIFSLWNVKDQQTKDLMVYFYKQVLKGKGYSKSLRQAKLKLISNPATASPKYWAAWVLVGR